MNKLRFEAGIIWPASRMLQENNLASSFNKTNHKFTIACFMQLQSYY